MKNLGFFVKILAKKKIKKNDQFFLKSDLVKAISRPRIFNQISISGDGSSEQVLSSESEAFNAHH